jgi:hypothetical protein
VTGGAAAGSSGLRGIVVLGVDSDGPWIRKPFILTMAGETEGIIVICFDQLGSTGPSMGIMAIEAMNPRIEMFASLKVKPLLMVGFRMGLRISPDSRLKLVIVGQGFSYFIRFVILVVPGKFKSSIGDTDPSRMALATDLEASFVGKFSWMDDFPFGSGRFDMVRAWAMAFFTSDIEFNIFGFVPSINLLQLKPGIVTASTTHLKGLLDRR